MAQDVRNSLNQSPKPRSTGQPDLLHSVYLILSQVPRFGVQSLNLICEKYSISPVSIVDMNTAELTDLGFDQQQRQAILYPNSRILERAKLWLDAGSKRHCVHLESPDYPWLLKEISSPPMILFAEGSFSTLDKPQLSIVGSRTPTHSGRQAAQDMATRVSQCGWGITSGLARGIDTFAHRGALDAGGSTTAVLGSGLDCVYPKSNVPLAKQILDSGGLLLSEFLPGTHPRAEHFPRRNRIVSGLSHGVLIVEAALKSGSLITARYALEQNRDVFAMPGNIHNPLSAGCHFLIKHGAKLVESINDIFEEFQNVNSLSSCNSAKETKKSPDQSLATAQLLDSVDFDVTTMDVILQRTELPIEVVLAQLLDFELRGLVAPVSGGYVKLRGK